MGTVRIPGVVVFVHVRRTAVGMGMAVLMVVGVAVIVRMAVDRIAVGMRVLMVMRVLVAVLVFVLAFHGTLPLQFVL